MKDDLKYLYTRAGEFNPVFFIDKVDSKINWGITTDSDKIEFNRNFLADDFNQHIDIQLAIHNPAYCVFPVGRFIVVLRSLNKSTQEMQFFDFKFDIAPLKELKQIWENTYSKEIVIECIKIYDFLGDNFDSSNDIFSLSTFK